MASEALIETWCLYTVGSLIIFARVGCRWRMVGLANFRPDDYIILLSWAVYTVMTVAAHMVGGYGDLHALTLDVRKNMTTAEAAPYVYGTQWFCAGVATYNLFIWTLKLNMLFLYQRVVKGIWVEKFIKPTMCILGVTFLAVILALFCACRPYNRMWIVYPDQGEYCEPQSTLQMALPLIMNVLTDMMIMAIPIPVVITVRIGWWKRIGVLSMFGAGIFIMIAAILRATMVLVMKNGSTAAIWSCREDFVAIVVGQAVLIRPIFSKSFWIPGSYQGSGGYSHEPSKGSAKLGSSHELQNQTFRSRHQQKDPFSITQAMATVMGNDSPPISPNGSTENIIKSSSANEKALHTIGEDSTTVGSHSVSSSADLESGTSTYNHSQKMVIHVSKKVSVENTEPIESTQQNMYWAGDSLHSTNDARAWKDRHAI